MSCDSLPLLISYLNCVISVFVVLGASGCVGTEMINFLRKQKVSVRADIATAYHKSTPQDIAKKLNEDSMIYHFAQISRVPLSIQYPYEVFNNNVKSISNVLEAIRLSKYNHKIIFASSREVYGVVSKEITASAPRSALNPYAASKIASEALIESYVNTYDIKATIVRLSSVYGSIYDHPTRIIPRTILYSLIAHKVNIYKDDVKKIFDFVFIDDVIYALYQIAIHNMPLYNHITTGIGLSLDYVCSYIAFLTGATKEYYDTEERKYTVDQRYFVGIPKFKKYFPWNPLPLPEGLNKTIKRYRKLPPMQLYELYKKAYNNDNTSHMVW